MNNTDEFEIRNESYISDQTEPTSGFANCVLGQSWYIFLGSSIITFISLLLFVLIGRMVWLCKQRKTKKQLQPGIFHKRSSSGKTPSLLERRKSVAVYR